MTEQQPSDAQETGIEVPYEQIASETLRKMIEEFVTRDGTDWSDAGGTLTEKVSVVLQQLHNRQVQVVFDLASHSANLVLAPGHLRKDGPVGDGRR